jgi:hypothetical protein
MSGAVLAASRRALSSSYRRPAVASLTTPSGRWYSSTRPSLEEEAAKPKKKEDTAELRQIALEYGRQKSSYKRQVSLLRKEYMEEYQRHKAEDEAQRDAERAETTRRRLERQRAKNEISVQNAIRQEELRRQTHLAFQDHLRVQQEKRTAQKKLFTRARQSLIDELEEEAPLWLTSPEEVEAAFTPEAEQLLWARPQGLLGAPNPSLDSHFWQFESHTWEMSKTYKTQQDVLLEDFEEEVFDRTNLNPEFWTLERVQALEELERKAKLRANVRLEGRRSLLKRQKEYLDEDGEAQEGEPPKSMPVPSLGVLSDVTAQEKEGAELLFKDPTRFFVFDRDAGETSGLSEKDGESESESYSGPSLGVPVGIRDPLRSGSPQGRVFPVGVGKLPKPDTRSEKEKKRQEREEKLWAAAQAQARSDMDEIDMAADEDADFGKPLDYDQNDGWDSDDEEWVKGMDTERDADILNVPREFRYREQDIDFVIDKLEKKANVLQSHVRNTVSSMEQEARSKMDRRDTDEAAEDDVPKFLDDSTREKLQNAGADADKYESLMQSLSEDQLLSLFASEAERRESDTESTTSAFEAVTGLTEEQITGLTEMEAILLRVESESDSTV